MAKQIQQDPCKSAIKDPSFNLIYNESRFQADYSTNSSYNYPVYRAVFDRIVCKCIKPTYFNLEVDREHNDPEKNSNGIKREKRNTPVKSVFSTLLSRVQSSNWPVSSKLSRNWCLWTIWKQLCRCQWIQAQSSCCSLSSFVFRGKYLLIYWNV